jgi:four helix bundle protein
MSTIRQFEELLCWQKARLLTREVYKIFKDPGFKDYGLQDQMQRAAVSVMSNVAEGFERGTRQEFLNYLFIAKGSCGEVRAQLYVALDAGYVNEGTFGNLKSKAEECSRLISNFIQSIKVSKFQGLQYKQVKTEAQKRSEAFSEQIRRMVEEGRKERERRGEY